MATRLSLYNDALLLVGERALASLTETTEPRRLLDQVWNNNGVDACLEEAQWTFAMRTVQIDYDTALTPSFGYARAFTKPTDWIRTSAVCADEYFESPVTGYVDEAGYWYADLDTIYVRYVSNDTLYGGNIGAWPKAFTEFAAAHFASLLILKTTNDTAKLKLFVNPERPEHSIRGRALLKAKSQCAMAGPTKFLAQGAWTKARTRGTSNRDGGSTTNLTG